MDSTHSTQPCEINAVVLPLRWGLALRKHSLLAEDLASG